MHSKYAIVSWLWNDVNIYQQQQNVAIYMCNRFTLSNMLWGEDKGLNQRQPTV